MHHFIQRRSDQSTQTYYVHLLFHCFLHDGFGRNHDSQVDDFIIVAGHDYRHDVLADIMHIPLDRSQENLSRLLHTFFPTGFQIRLQDGNGLLHGTGRLYHLRQEHLTGTEQLAHLVHTIHQRTFDDVHHLRVLGQRFLQIGFQVVSQSLHQSILQAFFYRSSAPGFLAHRLV